MIFGSQSDRSLTVKLRSCLKRASGSGLGMIDRERGQAGQIGMVPRPSCLPLQPPDLIQQPGRSSKRSSSKLRKEHEELKTTAIEDKRCQEQQTDGESKCHLLLEHVLVSVMPTSSGSGYSTHHQIMES